MKRLILPLLILLLAAFKPTGSIQVSVIGESVYDNNGANWLQGTVVPAVAYDNGGQGLGFSHTYQLTN